MIINTTDAHMGIFAGIVVYDSQGDLMPRVQEIDTETLCCRIGPFGKTTQAAGFALIPTSQLFHYIPDGLLPFVCPVANPTKEQLETFIKMSLQHRRACISARYQLDQAKGLIGAPKGTTLEDMVDTYTWPREPFKAMAEAVQPSKEEEAAVDAQRLKDGKTAVLREGEMQLKGKVITPWKEEGTFDKFSVSSLWLWWCDGEVVQWGVAVNPPSSIHIVNNVIELEDIQGIEESDFQKFFGKEDCTEEVSNFHRELRDKTWQVVAMRGKPNKTVEIMLCELKEDADIDIPSWMEEKDD